MTISFDADKFDLLESSGIRLIDSELAKAKSYGSKSMLINLLRMDKEDLDKLMSLLKAIGKPFQNQYNYAKVSIDLIKNPTGAKVSRLDNLIPALESLFKDYLVHGYLFKYDKTSGQMLPYVPTQVKMVTPRDSSNYVTVVLQYYSQGENKSTSIDFSSSDIRSGATVIDLVMDKDFVLESPELVETYMEQTEIFLSLVNNHGQQYTTRVFSTIGERYSWDVESSKLPSAIKVVNNIKEFKDFKTPRMIKSDFIKDEILNPVHPFLPIFILHKHKNGWVHVNNSEMYEYNPNIKSKLVLHPDHEDLIDALAETYTIDVSDIIEEKSGGTIILGTGAAGIGKTLTAEVMSEVIQKPLYKVNVSLFGTEPEKIEGRLQTAFDRANSWGAILLLDEADLYIMERDTNIQHNGIVTVFLKGLEYSKGLTFLTTNKGKNVDEAILSRCTAVIHYEMPTEDARRKMWNILSAQFELTLSDDLVEQLTSEFKTASGRDIKMLCILVFKYCKAKSIEPSFEIFKKLAVFRNMASV